MNATVIGIAGFVVLYGSVSRRLSSTVLTGPMVFTAFGLALGNAGLGVIDLETDLEVVRILAELTLALVLFIDAARIDLRRLRRSAALPGRMLASLPFTIILGTIAGQWLFPGLDLFSAAVLAAVLAPTDAALGQAVVTDPRIPVRIRQTLNVESGLNDGIVLPAVAILLGLAGMQEGLRGASDAGLFIAQQLGFGVLVGLTVGCAGAWVIGHASARGWMEEGWRQLATLAVAVSALTVAEVVGGNGFIAAFVGGMAFGSVASHELDAVYDFAEEEGSLLTLLVFAILGASLAPQLLRPLDGATVVYILLSLTVVRMVPIALSLLGSGLRPQSLAFLGWFGPRGLATILFGLLVVEGAELPAGEEILSAALWTVLFSIVAHGVSALPLTAWYARSLEDHEPTMPEMQPTEVFRTR